MRQLYCRPGPSGASVAKRLSINRSEHCHLTLARLGPGPGPGPAVLKRKGLSIGAEISEATCGHTGASPDPLRSAERPAFNPTCQSSGRHGSNSITISKKLGAVGGVRDSGATRAL